MSQDYNPNSIDSALSRIETKLTDLDAKVDRIEEGQAQLWKSQGNLKAKVAGIATTAGVAVALGIEWAKDKMNGK